MLINSKCMLIYGFNEEEKKLIFDIIQRNNLPFYKIITNNMINVKIKDILEEKTSNFPYQSKLINEKIIIFNDFSDDNINIVIQNLRNYFKAMPILAVVTETSINWTFEELAEHLIEEREWHRKNEGKV